MRAAILLLALTAVASADPGDELIDKLGLSEIRGYAGEIERLPSAEPLDDARYTAVIELRARHPILIRLGALDDPQLAQVAAALCRNASPCTASTTRALRCLAERCSVALTTPEPHDLLVPEPECMPNKRRKKAPLVGVGFDWSTGIQRSGAANDGRVSGFGISARLRVSERYGFVARADRMGGRDEATDEDGNGVDDFESSSVTRFALLAGPSIVLDSTKLEGSTRSVRLDLLAGYLATKTLPGEDGLAVGADLALQLSLFKVGLRLMQGLGEADRATMLVAHLGLAVGSTPTHTEADECPPRERRSSPFALGFELPITGAGLSSQLGYMAIGFGGELIWKLTRKVDAVVHGDLLHFPRANKDRVVHQAALVGVRYSGKAKRRRPRTSFWGTLMTGVTHGADVEPSTVGDGPIVDASIAWGIQDDEVGGYLRLHGRAGLAPANEAYRVLFLSIGWELHADQRSWRDRSGGWY